jgi:hypothetical protein
VLSDLRARETISATSVLPIVHNVGSARELRSATEQNREPRNPDSTVIGAKNLQLFAGCFREIQFAVSHPWPANPDSAIAVLFSELILVELPDTRFWERFDE